MTATQWVSVFACFVLSLTAGAAIGCVDLQVEEVQWPVLLLLFSGICLGFVWPRLAAMSALVLGSSIPVTHLIAPHLGIDPVIFPTHFIYSFIALVPAFLGCFAGALARNLMKPV
jgi:hypothetical protein